MKKIIYSVMAILGLGLILGSCTKTVSNGNNSAQALTETFTISPSAWTGSGGNYTYGVNLTSFDKSIHDNGAYWAYISFDNGASYELLSTNNNGYTFYATFDKDPSTQNAYGVTIQAIGQTNTSPSPNTSILIKVVSIPSSLVQSANVNFNDYVQVQKAFNLR